MEQPIMAEAQASADGGVFGTPEGDVPDGLGADPSTPPRGAWYSDDGVAMRVGSSTRSIGLALFMLLIGTLWTGTSAMFLAFAITAILQSLGFIGGATAGSLGAGVFMLVFSVPFLGAGLWILWTGLMAAGGRVAVTLRGDDLAVFTGIGPVGRRHRLAATSVEAVVEDVKVVTTRRGSTTTRSILLRVPGTKGVRFGSVLSQRRRDFVLGILRQVLGR